MKFLAKTLVASSIINVGIVSAVFTQYDPRVPFEGQLGKTIEETKLWYPQKNKAREGSPNIIWILLDDVGYAATSAFGGIIETPFLESIANNGLRYTNFHNVGVCAPTRAALLSGRNSHAVGFGYFPSHETTPGYNGRLPFESGIISEVLLENGYNTIAVGKWHVIPHGEETQAGPFNRWPLGRGFEQFYGFLGGATDQWHPQLWEGNHKVNIESNKKHLSELLADKAISYIANQKSANTDKPFFLYLAPGATHSPHQAPEEWIKKYKGRFDDGWDAYREKVFQRQKQLGVIPANTVLTPRDPQIKAWNSLSSEQKKLYAHFMEVYAAYLSHVDDEIGRVFNYLKQVNQFDNTLIVAVLGDNGGTRRGDEHGTLSERAYIKKTEEEKKKEFDFMLSQTGKIGSEFSYPVYPEGWGHADNTPFRYWKYDANGEGGTHTPLIISYPEKIKERGVREQYGHVIDLLPTTLAITGTKLPEVIKGYKQDTLHGIDLSYSISNPNASSARTIQYYEIAGNRAIYKDGWKAAAFHKGERFEDDKWELFKIAEDWSESKDLSHKYPEKLVELKKVFDNEAIKYNVYPIKGRSYVAQPDPSYPIKTEYVLYPGAARLWSIESPKWAKGRFSVSAFVGENSDVSNGVLLANGGKYGGFSFFVKNRKLHFAYTDGRSAFLLSSDNDIPDVSSVLKFDFIPFSDHSTGGEVILFINNKQVGKGKIDHPVNYKESYSAADEGLEIGQDSNTPVSKAYHSPFLFTGKLNKVVIETK